MIRRTRSDDGILTITIDNTTSANALRPGMLDALIYAFEAASDNQELRGVLLTSAGHKGFSAGMDTSQFKHANASLAHVTITRLGQVCEAIKNCDLPVAVAIEGYRIGGAAEIAAAADFRVGGTNSWYSMPEVRIGIPSVLESVNLHRLMGWTKATELILTGSRFTAADMDRCGFLNTVVEDSEVEARALEYLHETMKADRAVIAQQKRLHRTWKNSFEREALADSRKEFALAFARKND
ncbi:MAG: enoyl-CoA hydratase/isomerase family protein [Brevibacterium sp.]|nr:enoyl-CoA hydratase/isomerase family protein [Brevibacterium sp.]